MMAVDQILTWTLVHSIWIAIVIWLLTSITSVFFHKSSTRRRIKIGGFLLFVFGILIVLFNQTPALPDTLNFAIFGGEVAYFEPTLTWMDEVKLWISDNSTIISSIWLMGCLAGIIRFMSNRKTLSKCKSTAIQSSDKSMLNKMNQICHRLGIDRNVKLMISAVIDSPMTTGILKPVIYFPAGLISGFSSSELDTILLHELVHIKRHDYLVNLFLVTIETIFFFNPIILFLAKDLRREMEYVCDDEVLKSHSEIAYAKALVKLQEITISYQVAIAAKNNRSEFKNRIERMINQNNKKVSPKLGLVVLLFTSLLVSSAFVHSPSAPIEEAPPAQSIPEIEQDTLKAKTNEEMKALIKDMDPEKIKNTTLIVNGKHLRILVKANDDALKKAELMMEEIRKELIKDGILNEDKQKITLMFQYSDVLNGKVSLGENYEKYKRIFNEHFPKYDSFATTWVFKYKKEN